MEKENIIKIVEDNLCTGCGTCSIACAQQAILMKRDRIGNISPFVDADKCNHCGACYRVCPGIDVDDELFYNTTNITTSIVGEYKNVYVGQATDNLIYQNSQSGGSVSAILKYLFKAGKIDAALVVCQKNGMPFYKLITSKEQLRDCQKSQYVSVDLVSGLKDAVSFPKIAVVGLPCHLEGIQKLQKMNSKYAKNVCYKIGLICGGTFPTIISDVVFQLARVEDKETARIIWRFKDSNNYKQAKIQVFEKKGEGRISSKILDRQIRHEAKHILTPLRCRLCFDKLNLHADIVMGDPWGMSDINNEKGNNVIITRTVLGEQLLHDAVVSGDIVTQSAPMEEVIKGQGIQNKISYVQNSIQLYERRGYKITGWAHWFKTVSANNQHGELESEFSTFEKLSGLEQDVILTKVIRTIRFKLMKNKIKSLINKLKY